MLFSGVSLLFVFLFQLLLLFDQSVQVLPKQTILILGSSEMFVGDGVFLSQ